MNAAAGNFSTRTEVAQSRTARLRELSSSVEIAEEEIHRALHDLVGLVGDDSQAYESNDSMLSFYL